jgi:hypothetical protein
VIIGLFIFYPRAEVSVVGNFVRFSSINANVIVISENPDFSNPRYLLLNETKAINLNLKPGTYYWKGDNGFIEGMKNEFTIKSEVNIKINNGNESEVVNVGNVKINLRKNQDGVMVGKIILDTNESEKIENTNETYVGGQE